MVGKQKSMLTLEKEDKQAIKKKILGCFSKKMLMAREKSNITQKDLADKIGTSNTHINRYEKGEQAPTLINAKLIADVLNKSLDWLCSEDVEEEKENDAEDKNEKWENIPIIYALLAVLDKFSPKIEFGNSEKNPCITLSFCCNEMYFGYGEKLQKFFHDYQPIQYLLDSGGEVAEAIDVLVENLIKKYEKL